MKLQEIMENEMDIIRLIIYHIDLFHQFSMKSIMIFDQVITKKSYEEILINSSLFWFNSYHKLCIIEF